jgi:AcrR family transcriptional regulator
MARKARVDRAALVDAAARLVNTEGVDALSLSRLAGEMGVRTPSLYNHVDGLPGLQRELALRNAQMLADVFADAAIGRAGADAVLALAQAFRDYIKQNPGIYMVSQRVTELVSPDDAELSTAMDRSVRIVAAVIASFGLQGDDALHAVRALRATVHGFATLEVVGGFGLPLDCDESFRRLILVLVRGLSGGGNV